MTLHHWIWPPYWWDQQYPKYGFLKNHPMGSHSLGISVLHPIQIRETAQNADALSRFPRPVSTSNDCVPADVVAVVDHLSSLALNAQAIKGWTAKDPSSPASEDLLSLVGQLTSSLPSTNPMLVARTNSVCLIAACCGLSMSRSLPRVDSHCWKSSKLTWVQARWKLLPVPISGGLKWTQRLTT